MGLCFSSSSLNFIPLSSLPMVLSMQRNPVFGDLIGSTKKRCFPVVSHRKIQKTSWGFRFKPGEIHRSQTGTRFPWLVGWLVGWLDPGPGFRSFEIDPLSFWKEKEAICYMAWLFPYPVLRCFSYTKFTKACILYKKTTE